MHKTPIRKALDGAHAVSNKLRLLEYFSDFKIDHFSFRFAYFVIFCHLIKLFNLHFLYVLSIFDGFSKMFLQIHSLGRAGSMIFLKFHALGCAAAMATGGWRKREEERREREEEE